MDEYKKDFIDLALSSGALRFGTFSLKSGRISPYFFNAGLFSDGLSLTRLGRCYAATLVRAGFDYDMLFGPAYKGIPLVTAAAVALAEQHGRNVPWAFNRKEPKDHGEAGMIVGSPLRGNVVIVDDVMTAGTAVRESLDLIREAGAAPRAVLLAFDRQELGQGNRSAVQEITEDLGLTCVCILTFSELIDALQGGIATHIDAEQMEALRTYRLQYGAL